MWGNIVMKTLSEGAQCSSYKDVGVEAHRGRDGNPGKNGQAGKGGVDGKRGADCARIETGYFSDQHHYFGNCSLVYSSSSSDASAWCPYKQQYVTVKCSSGIKDARKRSDGKCHQRDQTTAVSESQILRKVSILEEEIRSQFSSIRQTDTFHEITLAQEICREENYIHKVQQSLYRQIDRTVRLQPYENDKEAHREPAHHVFIPISALDTVQKHELVCMAQVTTQNNELAQLVESSRKQMSFRDIVNVLDTLYQLMKGTAIKLTEESGAIIMLLDNVVALVLDIKSMNEEDCKKALEIVDNMSNMFIDSLTKKKIQQLGDLILENYKVISIKHLCLRIQQQFNTHCEILRPDLETAFMFGFESLLSVTVRRMQNIGNIQLIAEEMENAFQVWEGRAQQLQTPTKLPPDSSCSPSNTFRLLDEPTIDETLDERGELIDDETDIDYVFEQTTAGHSSLESTLILTQEKNRRKEYCDFLSMITDEQIKQILSKLQYKTDDSVTQIAQIVAKRIQVEGLQIHFDIFRWLMLRTLNEVDEYGATNFIVLFGTNSQKEWLIGYILLQLRKTLALSLTKQFMFQRRCKEFSQLQILLFLSQQLSQHSEADIVSLDDIYAILETSNMLYIDTNVMEQLQSIHISGWPLRLKWLNCLMNISTWKVIPALNREDIQTIAFYVFELENRYSRGQTDKLVKIINNMRKHIDRSTLLELLSNLYRNKWMFDEGMLEVLKKEDSTVWIERIKNMFHTQRCRHINDLIDLIGRDTNNSVNVIEELPVYKIIAIVIEAKGKSASLLYTSTLAIIDEYSKTDINSWTGAFHQFKKYSKSVDSDQIMFEVIAVINQAVFLLHGFRLRSTQLLSLVIFIHNKKQGILEQVSTGEGKTLIIAALAIFKVLMGENVDILTSSPILAQRDASINRDMYQLFHIKVGHNSSEKTEERKKVYVDSDVVYGEIGAFQRDILQDNFYNEDNGIGSRQVGTLIVDEVDSMLLDKGHNILYLSHVIPGMDALEPLYVYIWNLAHAKDISGSTDDIALIKEAVECALYPVLRRDDILSAICSVSAQQSIQPNEVWKELLQTQVIDESGKLLNVKDIENGIDVLADVKNINCELKEVILCQMKNVIRKGSLVNIPKSLSRFVELHMEHWIKNAFIARFMQLNEDYIIDIDRSDNAQGLAPNIVIMDNDTGVEQYHSQWSSGLHQFLQLKHECRLSLESLKAVFISNVTFFKRYGTKLYGLSGTLGSRKEREFLQYMYSVDYAIIPTFKQSQFIERIPKLCPSEEVWIQEIINSIDETPSRPVLVICQNVLAVDKLEKHIGTTRPKYIYKRSYEPLLGDEEELDDARVIVATNLAGRGTDLKITDHINTLGGLHVCLTYLPSSIRIEEQAFGRSARKGQQGSGQIVCQGETSDSSSELDSVIRMKIKRNLEEENHVDELQCTYMTTTEPEENLFSRFKGVYRRLEKQLNHINMTDIQGNIILQNTLDNWAFWLDEVNCINAKSLCDVNISSFLKTFETAIDNRAFTGLIDRPAHKIKLAKFQIGQKMYQKATLLLQEVIDDDLHFSDIAHYYMCHALLRWKHARKESQIEELYLHVYKAKEKFNQKIESQSLHVSTVSFIAKAYKEQRQSFVSINEYESQKRDVIDLYNIFIQSLHDITGYEVTGDMLETESVDPIKANSLVQHLKETGVIQNSKINSTQSYENIKQKYELHFDEIKQTLIDLKHENTIRRKSLKHALPSREEFWQVMKDANVLTDVKEFVLIDADELKRQYKDRLDSGLILDLDKWIKTSTRSRNEEFDTIKGDTLEGQMGASETKQVCLHSEQLKDIQSRKYKAFSKQDFKETFGNLKLWASLRRRNVILVNALGTFHVNEKALLGKYDGISNGVFTEIKGVTLKVSEEIFKDLLKQGLFEKIDSHYSLNRGQLDNWTLTQHRQHETEVFNIVHKHFKYRLTAEELATTGSISLPAKSHHELYEDLLVQNCISPCLVDSKLNEDNIKAKLRACSLLEKEHPDIDHFSRIFANSVCGLKKLDEVDSQLKNLEEYMPQKEKFQKSTELCTFYSNGLYHVIVLEETRWSTKAILSIIAVVCIGIVQIALGVILEVFSAGAGTFVASGLISEGVNDIMFAMECAYTGYFSWKSYAINKAISICFTVLTAGVGALLSRGAKFSKFGYKIGGKYLQHLSGKKLIEEVGKYAIIKQAVYRCGKKLGTTFALSLASQGMEMLTRYLQKTLINKTCQNVIDTIDLGTIHTSIGELCEKVGTARGKRILQAVTEKVFGPASYLNQMLEKVTSYLTRTSRALCQALSQASQKMENNEFTFISNTVSQVLKYTEMAKAVAEISKMIKEFTQRLLDEIRKEKSKESKSETDISIDSEEIRSISVDIIDTWKGYIVKDVSTKLTNDLVKPIMDSMANTLVHKAGQAIKDACRSYKAAKQKEQFLKLKIQKDAKLVASRDEGHCYYKLEERIMDNYHTEMSKLLQQTRDPQLYADIIREGCPVGIHCVQAVAEALGRPITIIPKNTASPFPITIEPSSPMDLEPIELGFESSVNGVTGHFTDPGNSRDTNTEGQPANRKNDCLFEAISRHCPGINRNNIAAIIENNTTIQQHIRMGVHNHFMKKGAFGGVQRSARRQQKMNTYIQTFGEHAQEEPIKYHRLRDKPGCGDDAVKNTGNHELYPTRELKRIIERADSEGVSKLSPRDANTYNMIDVYTQCRVDTRYVCLVVESKDGVKSLQGHDGALFSSMEMTNDKLVFSGKQTKGQPNYHNKLTAAVRSAKTPQGVAVAALVTHLKETADGNQIKSAHYDKAIYTAMGQNLSQEKDRIDFCRGVERERFKQYVIAQKINGNPILPGLQNPPQGLKNDWYCKEIRQKVKQMDFMQLGEMLMKPAPYN